MGGAVLNETLRHEMSLTFESVEENETQMCVHSKPFKQNIVYYAVRGLTHERLEMKAIT